MGGQPGGLGEGGDGAVVAAFFDVGDVGAGQDAEAGAGPGGGDEVFQDPAG